MRRRNLLATILGTLAVVGLTVLSVLFFGFLGTRFLALRFSDAPVAALLPWLIPGVILAFVGFEAIFILLSPEVERGDALGSSPRKRLGPKQKRVLILVILLLLVLLFLTIPNAQILCDADGITVHYVFSFTDHHYSWEDVSVASVADHGTTFSFNLKMKDGKSFDLMGYSSAETEAFTETYGDILGYMVFVDGQLIARGKFKTVKVSDSLLDALREVEDWERIAPLFDAH